MKYIGIKRGRLNINMMSYKYNDSYCKDKTVSRPSHLYNGNLYTWETVFILRLVPATYTALPIVTHMEKHTVSGEKNMHAGSVYGCFFI